MIELGRAAFTKSEATSSIDRVPGGASVFFYPIGHSLASAQRHAAIIYANILFRATSDALEAVAAPHKAAMLADRPDCLFTFERHLIADQRGVERAALLRTAGGTRPTDGNEHALYIDYGDAVLLLVLNSPPGKAAALLPLLFQLYAGSFTMQVEDRRGAPEEESCR